ncbi:MAG: response regulator [Mariprofundaceae bacterium]|nr:response regulator [Mariprofundaceae bacterium]
MKSFLPILLLTMIGLSLLNFMFGSNSYRVDLKNYHQIKLLLGQIKDEDMELNEHMLMAGGGMLKNFDSMVHIVKEINSLKKQFKQSEEGLSKNNKKEFLPLINQLFTLIKVKTEGLEQYKEEYAILHNSRAYLPTAIAHIIPELSTDVEIRLYDLTSHIYVYINAPSIKRRQRILDMIQLFEGYTINNDARNHLTMVFKHLRIIMNGVDALQKTSSIIMGQTTSKVIESIELQQQQLHDQSLDTNDIIMLFLSFLVLSLFAYMSWVMYRLRVTADKLQSNIAELNHQKFALDEHAIVSATDMQGDITYVNDKFCSLSGYSQEELLGKNHRMIKSDEHNPEMFQTLWASISHGKPWHGEIKNIAKNGSFYWVDATIVPFMDDAGKPFKYIGIRTDITSKKAAAEEKLANSENNLFRVFECTPIPLAIIDNLDQGKVLLCNHAMKQLQKLNDYDAQPNKIFESAIDPKHRVRLGEKLAEKGHVSNYELGVKFQGMSEKRCCLMSLHPIQFSDEKAFLISLFDISKRKQDALELERAKEDAEDAARAKGDFLANMSHEIRTPMNAIMGLAELALMADLPPKQRDYLTKINRSATALLSIINDILDFSKIDAGKMDMEDIAFDLQDVLDHVTDMIALKASEKNLEFLIVSKPNLHTALIGDPLRLGQILINLANNAVKFTASGDITIVIDIVEQTKYQIKLSFMIKDTGIGMTETQLAGLFQSFSQADTSTTRKYGGTGLGLTISKKLVEMMGGEIGVNSVSGQGSTFYFTAMFGFSHNIKKIQHIPSEMKGLRALIVDDHAASREVLLGLMDSLGFQSGEACSGAEAIQKLESANENDPYQLVLMDWKMPGMDGLEAGRYIKQQMNLTSIPTMLIVTAHGQESLKEESERSGFDGYLLKPVNQSSLFDSLGLALKLTATANDTATRPHKSIKQASHGLEGRHVLLVEDNDINQQIAIELLAKASIRVSIAENGKKGVDAVKSTEFDAILMDIQMPIMDGVEATQKIRYFNTNIPIIAMTANAMSGDRERCIACGMNDYITKPIHSATLFDVLKRQIKSASAIPSVVEEEPNKQQRHCVEVFSDVLILDTKQGLSHVDHDKDLYATVLKRFCNTRANTLSEIKQAIADHQLKDALRIAHTLKGIAATIGAPSLAEAALDLERVFHMGEIEPSNPLYATAEKELAKVLDAAKAYLS